MRLRKKLLIGALYLLGERDAAAILLALEGLQARAEKPPNPPRDGEPRRCTACGRLRPDGLDTYEGEPCANYDDPLIALEAPDHFPCKGRFTTGGL